MLEMASIKEWRIKYEEIKRRHGSEIEKLNVIIEKLKIELEEYRNRKDQTGYIRTLEEKIQQLKFQWESHVCDNKGKYSDQESEYSEKLEYVADVAETRVVQGGVTRTVAGG